MLRASPLLALVVPCYNEEEILPSTADTLAAYLVQLKIDGLISSESFILYVDDGSKDKTWQILEDRHRTDPFCKAISFATNAGHQNAVWAGMENARELGVDCIISLDADLQDDISVIPEMLAQYAAGCDIVYGVRNDRSSDTLFKRRTAHFFYEFMSLLQVPLIPDHADFRLVARPVLDVLPSYKEQSLFLRGFFPSLGFKDAKVFYRRLPRTAGESKYPLFKMLSFAWKGLTSCSAAPLRIAGILSLFCMVTALGLTFVFLTQHLLGRTIQGWTSIVIVVLFLGSIQLFCLSVIGEYLAKIFTEVRYRPRYNIYKKLY